MKTKKTLKVNPYGFYKILNNLTDMGKLNTQLDLNGLREQFLIATDFDVFLNEIETEIKKAIQEVMGLQEMPENTDATEFNDQELISIQFEFKIIARKRKPGVKISLNEIAECETVNDCIELVISKL